MNGENTKDSAGTLIRTSPSCSIALPAFAGASGSIWALSRRGSRTSSISSTLLSHYTLDDLTSAGLPAEAKAPCLDKKVTDAKLWVAVEEYWNYSRFTGYDVNLRIGIANLYGFNEISSRTVEGINAAVRAKNKPGLYRDVLKNQARIQYYVLDDRHPHPSKRGHPRAGATDEYFHYQPGVARSRT